MTTPPATHVGRVTAEIRSDILAGRRRPGSRLRLADLTAHHACSMGVVREALSRLVAQGLVDAEPQHGFRVTPVSAEDLAYLTEARCAIEPLVLRDAIERGDLNWEGDLLSAHHRLSRTAQMEPGDPGRFSDDWAASHARFHEALLAGCPNPRLRVLASGLRDSAELYRRWSVPLGHDQDRDIAHEHASLLRATLDREADRAAALLAEHIRHTTRVLIENLSPRQADEGDTA